MHCICGEGSERLVKLNRAVNWVQIEEGNHTFNTVHPFKGTTKPLEKAIDETLAFIRKKLEDWKIQAKSESKTDTG